jgi:uncharacterized protein YjbI with pentapeptide repeats
MRKYTALLILLLIGARAFAMDCNKPLNVNQEHYREILEKSDDAWHALCAQRKVPDECTINIEQAQLEGTDLRRIILCEASLFRACLKTANLVDANFAGANLRKANLEDAQLIRTNFWLASLAGANLKNTNLEGANLENTDLHKTDLRGAYLLYTNLRMARNWEHAICDENTKLPEGFRCSEGKIVHE